MAGSSKDEDHGATPFPQRRVQAALRQQGWQVNHKKVRRLMRAQDLQPRVRRRYVTSTDSDHESPIFPNLPRDIVPNGPDRLWVADLTDVAVMDRARRMH